jgi:NTP pyrophosphatase (non-canonical NTP hydrolase)
MQDKLEKMFTLREEFMTAVNEYANVYPEGWPLELSEKSSQQQIREITLRGVEEIFEALQLLKNTKEHKKTNDPGIDRSHFLEEFVDAQNYFFSLLILAGYSTDDFYEAYEKKHNIILSRIKNKY